jgi:hypothetical protein
LIFSTTYIYYIYYITSLLPLPNPFQSSSLNPYTLILYTFYQTPPLFTIYNPTPYILYTQYTLYIFIPNLDPTYLSSILYLLISLPLPTYSTLKLLINLSYPLLLSYIYLLTSNPYLIPISPPYF